MTSISSNSSKESDAASWLHDYGDDLYRYALTRLRDGPAAEDVVQETLLAALKAQERFRGDSSVKTWLIGIMKFKIIDHFRKSKRDIQSDSLDQAFSSEGPGFDPSGHWNSTINYWADPDAALQQERFLLVYQQCIDALPVAQAQLFLLKESSDLSSDELCKVMNISTTNNLWVILSRTRKRLRDCLDKHWFNAE